MRYEPFKNGVSSVLQVHWPCTLKSPLAIRNGFISAFKQNDKQKGRGNHLIFDWERPELTTPQESEYSKISDFNYIFRVKESMAFPEYAIPPSSIRGVLRNEAIKRLVDIQDRDLFSLPKLENTNMEELEEKITKAKSILEERKQHWFNILSLFGNTFELDANQSNPYTWAGRFHVETMTFNASTAYKMQYSGKEFTPLNGPVNFETQIAVRNPLDRVTQGAKAGGLHTWVELAPNQRFDTKLTISNPTEFDLKLVQLWAWDINDGFIRFGALTQQGKGILKITNPEFKLFVSRTSPLWHLLQKDQTKDLVDESSLLYQIWSGRNYTSIEECSRLYFSK